ncbi:MAG: caspase family protein [Usitatibacter sp.]
MKENNEPSGPRRRIVMGGMAAAAGALLPSWPGLTHAQSEGASRLLRLPKAALVIGNGAYAGDDALANPVNDARALAEQLAAAGFAVDLRVDATRAQMVESIEAHGRRLAGGKGVGVFYFAGHGMQLAWRNYMMPVSAAVRSVEEIPAQGVDLGEVLDGIKRAANAMNLIIVDACRNNPFGGGLAVQKGLSQIDAPPGTLLAYSTSPGNTASDGLGKNGLYTEHLLREMKVRDAKIEDVFKRVRLGVRRQSFGRQIPWESTSLEEDFYFVPPVALARLSEEEQKRAFQEESEAFAKARDAKASPPLVDFLGRYPSGAYSELAQARLERVLAAEGEKPVEPAVAVGNPYTAGTKRADTAFTVGDAYAYRIADRLADTTRQARFTVTSITETEVHFNNGRMILDPLGNTILQPNGWRFTARQDQPLEYSVGKRWTTRFRGVHGGVDQGEIILDFRIVAREGVTVPAGTFECFRIEARRLDEDLLRRPQRIEKRVTFWMAPDRVRLLVAREEESWVGPAGTVTKSVSERRELTSFKQS